MPDVTRQIRAAHVIAFALGLARKWFIEFATEEARADAHARRAASHAAIARPPPPAQDCSCDTGYDRSRYGELRRRGTGSRVVGGKRESRNPHLDAWLSSVGEETDALVSDGIRM
jgi:hypothetical protein